MPKDTVKKKQIYAPLGYQLPIQLYVDDEANIRDFCAHMTDNATFIRNCYIQPLKELLKMLKENGFTIK